MNQINKAYYEIMTQGDKTGQPFTFPIPTVNITEDFDWDGENTDILFENTAKIGSSYFQDFIGSQYKKDKFGNREFEIPETGLVSWVKLDGSPNDMVKDNIPGLLEVSIGHALISESLYLGLENVVNMYLQKLK